jgi:cell division ATPase FtsA
VIDALKDAGLKPEQIDEVVLVGGSTRVPAVQRLVKELFKGKEPNRSSTPTRSSRSAPPSRAASPPATSRTSSSSTPPR